MKFNRTTLIASIDAEIVSRKERAEADFQKALAEYEKTKVKWLASEHPQALSDAAKAVVNKVRRGHVVTADDTRALASRYSDSHTFDGVEPSRATKCRQADTAQLQALREFLETVVDDEVTSSGLRDVGFRHIAQILRAAAS